MGIGDDLMAMGQAERRWRETGRRVRIVDAEGKLYWSAVWNNHPALLQPGETRQGEHEALRNGPGCRPYIDRWDHSEGFARPRARFTDWRAADHRGRLYLSTLELASGRELRDRIGNYVVIEPGIHGVSSPNKDWGFARYQAMRDLLPDLTFVQLEPEPRPTLRGVRVINTPTFREACGILASAAAYVGPEGGLHHAAAALRKPAVVLFGGFTAPHNTGYPEHVNLFVPGPQSPCGRYSPCGHCLDAMASIRPETVAHALAAVLAACPVGGES